MDPRLGRSYAQEKSTDVDCEKCDSEEFCADPCTVPCSDTDADLDSVPKDADGTEEGVPGLDSPVLRVLDLDL